MTVEERFLAKVKKTDTCWIWTGSAQRYGRFRLSGKLYLAHRISYELFIKRPPDELCVLHKCDVTKCVNPEHLFLGTQKDNALDREAKGRGEAGKYLLTRTHCRRGHTYAGDNLRFNQDGSRRCRICTNLLARVRAARKKLSGLVNQ